MAVHKMNYCPRKPGDLAPVNIKKGEAFLNQILLRATGENGAIGMVLIKGESIVKKEIQRIMRR